jgi:hypothetical protein
MLAARGEKAAKNESETFQIVFSEFAVSGNPDGDIGWRTGRRTAIGHQHATRGSSCQVGTAWNFGN